MILLQHNQLTSGLMGKLLGQPLEKEKRWKKTKAEWELMSVRVEAEQWQADMKEAVASLRESVSGQTLTRLKADHHLLCPFSKPQHTSSDTNTLDNSNTH